MCNELFKHAFEAHLLAAITTFLGRSSSKDEIQGAVEKNLSWVRTTAANIVRVTILPKDTPINPEKTDHVYELHRWMLYTWASCTFI